MRSSRSSASAPRSAAAPAASASQPQSRMKFDAPIMMRVSSGSACLLCANTPTTCGTTKTISPVTTSSATTATRAG